MADNNDVNQQLIVSSSAGNQAAAALAGQAVNTAGNIVAVGMQNAQNKELAEYQYQKNIEMWNAANAYNAPAAQMERLKAAGLNPNLVYGSSAVVGNTSTETPKYQAPRMEAPKINFDMNSVIAAYQNARQNEAQVNNLQALTNLEHARALTEGVNYQAGSLAYRQNTELYQTQIDTKIQELENLKKAGNLSQKQMDLYDQQIKMYQNELQNMEFFGTKEAPNTLGLPLPRIFQAIKQYFDKNPPTFNGNTDGQGRRIITIQPGGLPTPTNLGK